MGSIVFAIFSIAVNIDCYLCQNMTTDDSGCVVITTFFIAMAGAGVVTFVFGPEYQYYRTSYQKFSFNVALIVFAVALSTIIHTDSTVLDMIRYGILLLSVSPISGVLVEDIVFGNGIQRPEKKVKEKKPAKDVIPDENRVSYTVRSPQPKELLSAEQEELDNFKKRCREYGLAPEEYVSYNGGWVTPKTLTIDYDHFAQDEYRKIEARKLAAKRLAATRSMYKSVHITCRNTCEHTRWEQDEDSFDDLEG